MLAHYKVRTLQEILYCTKGKRCRIRSLLTRWRSRLQVPRKALVSRVADCDETDKTAFVGDLSKLAKTVSQDSQ